MAGGFDQVLETPGDTDVTRKSADTGLKTRMGYRKRAIVLVIDMDHAENWREANQYTASLFEAILCLAWDRV